VARERPDPREKCVIWVGSSKHDLLGLPLAVVDEIGSAISYAQFGGRHPSTKPWRGAGPGVLEIVQDHRGDTYRAVYSVRFPGVVYVLHCFQKKSPSGTRTSRRDISLLNSRLREARKDFEERYGNRQT
jgi:phage-related protein